MKTDPDDNLEQFIDAELKRLPELKAPSTLAASVMRRVIQPTASWWQSSWMQWPIAARIVSGLVFAALALLCVRGFCDPHLQTQFLAAVSTIKSVAANVSAMLEAVTVATKPLKGPLFFSLIIFCLLASFATVVTRALWLLTLNEPKSYER